ncbi:MAG: HAD hydrolase family protein [Holophaga sp.]|nr:HAD hydrolase family protein [Holophaga sp.]
MEEITSLALDVDGVLTDGTFWWGPGGEEFKRFSFRDVMGLSRGMKAGLRVVLISGEDTPLLDLYATKLGIQDLYRGCKDKASALKEYSETRGIPLKSICFMGDDINDLAAMGIAGSSAVPADGHPAVLKAAKRVMGYPGGNGAVREWVDLWLLQRG